MEVSSHVGSVGINERIIQAWSLTFQSPAVNYVHRLLEHQLRTLPITYIRVSSDYHNEQPTRSRTVVTSWFS